MVAVVVGSGVAATSLTTEASQRLLINSLVTAIGPAVLILDGSPSGLVEWLADEKDGPAQRGGQF